MSERKYILRRHDPTLVIFMSALLAIGLAAVLAATNYADARNEKIGYNLLHSMTRQAMVVGLGAVAAAALAKLPYFTIVRRLAIIPYLASLGLLVFVLFTPAKYNVHRWIEIGGFSFQPSELAKVAMIVELAAALQKTRDDKDESLKRLFINLLIVAIPAGLVALGRDAGSALTLAAAGVVMTFLASGKPLFSKRTLLYIFAAAVLLGGLFAYLHFSSGNYHNRYMAWRDPFGTLENAEIYEDATGQVQQGLYAVSTGGVFGLPPDSGAQRAVYLPEARNDFIFAVICESFGLYAAAAVLALFALLIWKISKTAAAAPDLFGFAIASGAAALIGVQAIVNMSVVVGLIPITGITLPFLSEGGSSVICFMALMGVVISVSRYGKASGGG